MTLTRRINIADAVKELNENISRGIEFIKSQRPKGRRWEKGIDLSKLNMVNGCQCICGQSFVKEAESAIDGWNWAREYFPDRTGESAGFFHLTGKLIVNEQGEIVDGWTLLGDLWAVRIKNERRRIKKNLMRG